MLDFKNLDGFIRDLSDNEETKWLYADIFDYSDAEIEDGDLEEISLEFMRHSLILFYTSHYDYVFCIKPNVYFICEDELYTKGELK